MKVKIYQEFPVVLTEKQNEKEHYFVASTSIAHISAKGKSIAEAKANAVKALQNQTEVYSEFPKSFLQMDTIGHTLKENLDNDLEKGALEVEKTLSAYPVQSFNASSTNGKLKDNQAVTFATVLVVDADYWKAR